MVKKTKNKRTKKTFLNKVDLKHVAAVVLGLAIVSVLAVALLL